MDFAQARKYAADKGYMIFKEKAGGYSGSVGKIELEDSDLDSLLDDLDATLEMSESDIYTLDPEPDENEKNIVTATVNGAEMEFRHTSIAKALSLAKEAVLKHSPAPVAKGTRRKRSAESPADVAKVDKAEPEQEVLPPLASEPTASYVPKGGELLFLIDTLINALQSVRSEFAQPPQAQVADAPKPRGRPRRNGS